MILSFFQNTTAFGKLQQAVRLFEKIFRVDRTVEAGYNKKQKGTATAAGPLIANLTQLTARVPPGGQHAFGVRYSAIARTTTTQTATRRNCARLLLPIRITSPLSKFAGGSNGEPTAYVTVLLLAVRAGRLFHYTIRTVFCQIPPRRDFSFSAVSI